jgi:O-antigen/teichoic acid export membrane protein
MSPMNSDSGIASPTPTNPRQAKRVQSLKVGASAQILPLLVNYGANLLATPYVVSQLGLRDFGIWAMTGALAQYAALLDFGAARAANRYVSLFHARGETEKDRSVVGICVGLALGLGAVLYLMACPCAGIVEKLFHTGDSALTRFLLLSSVTILVCGLMARILAGASFGRGRQLPPNIGLAMLGASQVVSGVVALVFAPTLRSFALGTAVGAAIGLLAVAVVIVIDEGRISIGRPNTALAREIIGFGVKSQVAGAADVVLYQSGKLIAGIVIGPAAAGAYDLGIRLIQGVQAFGGAAAVAINTHLTRTYATSGLRGIQEQYLRLTQRNAAVAIFLPFLLGATAFSVVPLWLGEQQLAVVTVICALAFSVAMNVSTAVCSAAMYAVGRAGLMSIEGALYAAVSVLLAIPMAMAYGFNGLVAAYAGWMALGNLAGVWFMQTRIGISMKDFLRAVGGPFAIAMIAAMVAAPINVMAAPDTRADAITPFVLSSLAFCAVYLGLGWWLDYLPRFLSRAKRPLDDEIVTNTTASESERHDRQR